MDGSSAGTVMTLILAAVVFSLPVLAAWVGLVVVYRADRDTRVVVQRGFAGGVIAVGVASLIFTAARRLVGLAEYYQLVAFTPPVEETLKALAIVAATGATAVIGQTRFSLRRCAIATVMVCLTFAAVENLTHLADLVVLADLQPDRAAVTDTLRSRVLLPLLAHLAEGWAAGAAIWLARRDSGLQRLAVQFAGLTCAIAIHAMWNSFLWWWWPNQVPALVVLTLSGAAAAVFWLTALRVERRDRARDSVNEGTAGGRAEQPARDAVHSAARL